MTSTDNLLIKEPQCHRELFIWTEGKKLAKFHYTLIDLKGYYALSFYRGTFFGNSMTINQMDQLKKTAKREAPEWLPSEIEALLALVDKHGIEIVLYAIDLVESSGYPKVEEIQECIPDAEVVLANLIRNMKYGV